MTARLTYWYYTRPRYGRPLLAATIGNLLALISVYTAPTASASTNAPLLGFTGLSDSYGVPLGAYQLSLASVSDQITQAGPPLSNPGDWIAHAATVAATSQITAAILQLEAGIFIGVVALALWVMKILAAGYWLTLIGGIAAALTTAVTQIFTTQGLLLIAIPVSVFLGVMRIRRGEHGSGWTTILAGVSLPVAATTIFSDPAGLMYGRNGILDFGRRVGFSVAQAAHPGGIYPGDGLSGQVDTLTASLITHIAREPLQMWNFGHVIDTNPACAAAWSTAVRTGIGDAPIQAMHQCGDASAVAYALHIDGSNIWIGLVLILVAMLVGYAMMLCGWCTLKVLIKAVWSCAAITVVLWTGALFTRRATDMVWQFFKHGIELMTWIIAASVVGVAVEYTASHSLPADLGGDSVFARVLVLALVALAAIWLLHHLHHELTGQPAGSVRAASRVTQVATGMAIGGALRGGAGAAMGGLKGMRGDSRSMTPWQQIDASADALGEHSSGFDPMPSRDETKPATLQTMTAPATDHAETGTQLAGMKQGGSSSTNKAPRFLSETDYHDMLNAETRQELATIPQTRETATAIDPVSISNNQLAQALNLVEPLTPTDDEPTEL